MFIICSIIRNSHNLEIRSTLIIFNINFFLKKIHIKYRNKRHISQVIKMIIDRNNDKIEIN